MKKNIIFTGLFFFAMAFGPDAFAQYFNEAHIHGFISQGYLKSSDNDYMAETEDGTLEYNELGVNFSFPISHQFRMGAHLFARDLGQFGNNEIGVDWAFGEYRVNNAFGVRAGNIKIVHGLYNEIRDVDAARSSVLLPRSVYLEPMRDVFAVMKGFSAFGNLPFGLSYTIGGGTMDIKVNSDIATVMSTIFTNGIRAAGLDVVGTVTSLNTEYMINASVQWETPFGLKLSFTLCDTKLVEMIDYRVAGGETDPSQPSDPIFPTEASFQPTVYTLSLSYGSYNTTFTLEGMLIQAGIELVIPSLDVSEKENQDLAGGYVSFSQRFTDIIEAGIYYSIFYENMDDKEGEIFERMGEKDHNAWEKDACISLRFDLSENWIIKLEGHLINGTNMIDNRVRTGDLSEDFSLYAVKATFNF